MYTHDNNMEFKYKCSPVSDSKPLNNLLYSELKKYLLVVLLLRWVLVTFFDV